MDPNSFMLHKILKLVKQDIVGTKNYLGNFESKIAEELELPQ